MFSIIKLYTEFQTPFFTHQKKKKTEKNQQTNKPQNQKLFDSIIAIIRAHSLDIACEIIGCFSRFPHSLQSPYRILKRFKMCQTNINDDKQL